MKKNKPTSPETEKQQRQFAAESNKAKDSGATKDPDQAALETSIHKRQQKGVHRQDGK